MLCSIIILSYNQLHYTKRCLESIRRYTTDIEYELIVIDNGSDQETIDYLTSQPDLKLIVNKENLGFAGGCNQGICVAEGEYIMLLNNDTLVTEKWLYNMVQLLKEHKEIAMTGPLTNATVGKQMISVPYGDNMEKMQEFAHCIANSQAKPWRTLRLVAFCILIRREVFDEIGLFDTGFKIGNYEDDDFNIRALQAGKQAYICRTSFIHHFMNVSFRQRNLSREKIMLANKTYLEEKWRHMDWNHHAVYNSYMLETILAHGGRKLFHIGCGIGALETEIRDRQDGWQLSGIEEHPVRADIAATVLDQLYCDVTSGIEKNAEQKFDVIVIECTLEKYGIEILRKIRSLLQEDGIVLLRVFNKNHITTIEKAVTGQVGGQLLCAASDEFSYYYGKEIEEAIQAIDFQIVDKKEIRKSLSSLQERILQAVGPFMESIEEACVYNRIYSIKLFENPGHKI